MNNGFYQNPVFPGTSLNNTPNQQTVPSYDESQKNIFNGNNVIEEQSYIENILRINKGKWQNYMSRFLDLLNGKIVCLQEL